MACSRFLVTIAGVIAALILALPVSASSLLTGSGTGTITSVSITPVLTADGNLIQERHLTGTVTGDLTGTFVEDVRGVIHPTGLVTFNGTMMFTGTVNGCGTGTFTLGVSGQGVTGVPVTDSSVRVINAASNTLAVHGVGTISQSGPALTYQVQYQC